MEVVSAPLGSPNNPEPANTKNTEPKVTWGTLGASAGGLLVTGLGAILTPDQELVPGLPDWVVIIVGIILPGLTTYFSGRSAPHQWRVSPGANGGAQGAGTSSTEIG